MVNDFALRHSHLVILPAESLLTLGQGTYIFLYQRLEAFYIHIANYIYTCSGCTAEESPVGLLGIGEAGFGENIGIDDETAGRRTVNSRCNPLLELEHRIGLEVGQH